MTRREFGSIERLPSGNLRAYYADPEGRTTVTPNDKVKPVRHSAPWTFTTRGDAGAWLAYERRLISEGKWTSPEDRRKAKELAEASRLPLYGEYAERWINQRKVKGRPLANRTKDQYTDYLNRFLIPEFGHLHLDEITPGSVNDWYDNLLPKRPGRKADTGEHMRSKVYSFARAVMNTAVSAHGPMPGAVNPFAVRGGGTSAPTRRRDDQVVSRDELKIMLDTMREDRRLMLLLAVWCGLRYSEIVALRRSDINFKVEVVRIERAVDRHRHGIGDKAPKSDAGNRDMKIPPHIVADVKRHLNTYVNGRDGLLFPGHDGGYLAPSTFYGKPVGTGWYAARAAAKRGDLHFHDLRATGATLWAQNGATDAEVQAFLGDSTPQAAQRYVRASRSRKDMLAAKLSVTAESGDW